MNTITKLRTQQITLDLPMEDAEVWVRAVLQKVIKDADYRTIQTVDREGAVNRLFSEFATTRLTIIDPVLGQEITLSGAGLGVAVGEFVKQWMLEDVSGTFINDRGDVIKG